MLSLQSRLIKPCQFSVSVAARLFGKKSRNVPTKYAVLVIPNPLKKYSYLVSNRATKKCVLFDPTEGAPVKEAIKNGGYVLEGVFSSDYQNSEYLKSFESEFPGVKIVSTIESGEKLDHTIATDEGTINFDGIEVKAINCPQQEKPSFIYEMKEDNGIPFLFTGNSLCLGGNGPVAPSQIPNYMDFIYNKILTYPDDTSIFYGNELSLGMLQFARSLEPDNRSIQASRKAEKRRLFRLSAIPSTPTSLQNEKQINPFLRADQETIQKICGTQSLERTFEEICLRRNNFVAKTGFARLFG